MKAGRLPQTQQLPTESPQWVAQTLRAYIEVVKHGTGPSFDVVFLDVTSRGKGWACTGVTLTVDLPPGLVWAVTKRGIPEGPCFSHLWAPDPRKPAKMKTELRQGVLSYPRGRKHSHFRSGMGCTVRGRVTKRARSEDSRGRTRGTERGDPGVGEGQEEAFHLGCHLSSVQIFSQQSSGIPAI